MEQDIYPEVPEPTIDSLMSQLHVDNMGDSVVGSAVASFLDDCCQFSSMTSNQLFFDDIMNFPSGYPSY
jgi:hypothetical protein